MLPFDVLFPQLAVNEYRVLLTRDDNSPEGRFVFRELYCTDRGCDCRRVLLQISRAERPEIVATINYGFEPSEPPFDDEPRIMLDPLNQQSLLSEGMQDHFESMLEDDASYHDQLVRHYTMWKAVVEDPSHPDHHMVRNENHDDPDFRPAFERREPLRRSGRRPVRMIPADAGAARSSRSAAASDRERGRGGRTRAVVHAGAGAPSSSAANPCHAAGLPTSCWAFRSHATRCSGDAP